MRLHICSGTTHPQSQNPTPTRNPAHAACPCLHACLHARAHASTHNAHTQIHTLMDCLLTFHKHFIIQISTPATVTCSSALCIALISVWHAIDSVVPLDFVMIRPNGNQLCTSLFHRNKHYLSLQLEPGRYRNVLDILRCQNGVRYSILDTRYLHCNL